MLNIDVRKSLCSASPTHTIKSTDKLLCSYCTHQHSHLKRVTCFFYVSVYFYSSQCALHLSICYLSGWSTTLCPPFYQFISLTFAWFIGQLCKCVRGLHQCECIFAAPGWSILSRCGLTRVFLQQRGRDTERFSTNWASWGES